MELVVLADTHLRSGIERLPAPVLEAVDGADVVLHAGDVVSARALSQLRRRAQVLAVCGNNDAELKGVLPSELAVMLEGVALAMVHDSGPAGGRAERLRRRFPEADLVVFGHSHVPVDAEGAAGQRLFNPGSPTQRRRQPKPTFGRIVVADGRIVERRVVPID